MGGTAGHHDLVDIELLYFADCPSWHLAAERLRAALAIVGRKDDEVTLRPVESDQEAVALQFPGSPTIRIDGRDAFASAEQTAGLTCRVYATPAGLAGAPTVDQLVHALLRESAAKAAEHR